MHCVIFSFVNISLQCVNAYRVTTESDLYYIFLVTYATKEFSFAISEQAHELLTIYRLLFNEKLHEFMEDIDGSGNDLLGP